MTDDLAGGAPAPAEPTVIDSPSNVPEPAPANEPTPRSAIDRAFEAVEKANPDVLAQPEKAAEQPKPVEGERERNPDGTFKAKEGEAAPAAKQDGTLPDPAAVDATKTQMPAGEAPSRFSADAKAAWKDAPEPVRAEVARMERELTQGLETYRADATQFRETFKPYVEMAKRSNIDPAQQLAQYVNIDMMLAKDFDAGIAQIFKNTGKDVRQWAAQIAGQPAPTPVPQDQVVAELKQQIAELKQGFQGVDQTLKSQQSNQIGQTLEQWTSKLSPEDQTLFNELDAEIAAHLREPSVTLADAFAKAKQDAETRYTRMFGPRASSAPAPVPTTPPAPDLAAQTRAGQLQISGAPGSGSNPASRKTPSSPRAALDDAFATLGL
jgi:gas vesicle protein